jgi:hypothetical protein
MKKAKQQWDNGLSVVDVIPNESKPKRKYKRRNKRATSKVYFTAYKQVLKSLSKEGRARVLDRNNNDALSQQFVKSVIALAEQDDK